MKRIRATMERLKIWKDSFEGRIIPLCGDISKPRLGLGEEDYSRVSKGVSQIFHAACPRSWVTTPDSSACYIVGTMHVIALARRAKLAIHALSTNWLDLQEEYATEAGESCLWLKSYFRVFSSESGV